jgi:hypothetical protein
VVCVISRFLRQLQALCTEDRLIVPESRRTEKLVELTIVATPAQGHRAAIARVRVGPSGVLHAAEPALTPYERIALDNAIASRR